MQRNSTGYKSNINQKNSSKNNKKKKRRYMQSKTSIKTILTAKAEQGDLDAIGFIEQYNRGGQV